MKKLILFSAIILSTFTLRAQFKFGAGGGLNFSSFSNENSSAYSSATGFNAGLLFEVKLPIELGIEADLLYSTKGSSVDAGTFNADYTANYLDVPVVAKLYMLKVISLQGGFQYSHLLSANTSIEGIGESDAKDLYNAGALSAVIGFGVDVSKLHVSTRYNFGLTDASDGGGTKINMLTITLGLWIKK